MSPASVIEFPDSVNGLADEGNVIPLNAVAAFRLLAGARRKMPSKIRMSLAAGTCAGDQFAAVPVLLSPPCPVQVSVAARAFDASRDIANVQTKAGTGPCRNMNVFMMRSIPVVWRKRQKARN